MKIRPITILTTAHVALAFLSWAALFSIAFSVGFSDEAYAVLYYVVFALVVVFALPIWVFMSSIDSELLYYGLAPVQIIYSFVSCNLALYVYSKSKSHNKAQQSDLRQ